MIEVDWAFALIVQRGIYFVAQIDPGADFAHAFFNDVLGVGVQCAHGAAYQRRLRDHIERLPGLDRGDRDQTIADGIGIAGDDGLKRIVDRICRCNGIIPLMGACSMCPVAFNLDFKRINCSMRRAMEQCKLANR